MIKKLTVLVVILLLGVPVSTQGEELIQQEGIPQVFKETAKDLGYRWVIYAEVGKGNSLGNPGAGNTECKFQIEIIPQNAAETRYPWALQLENYPPPAEHADKINTEYQEYLKGEAYITDRLNSLREVMKSLGYQRSATGIFACYVAFFKEIEGVTYKLIMTHDVQEILSNTGSGLPQVEKFIRSIYYPTLFENGPSSS